MGRVLQPLSQPFKRRESAVLIKAHLGVSSSSPGSTTKRQRERDTQRLSDKERRQLIREESKVLLSSHRIAGASHVLWVTELNVAIKEQEEEQHANVI